MNSLRGVLLVAGIGVVALSAAGFGGVINSVWAAETKVDVVLSDFSIAADPSSVPAGDVVFNAKNDSATEAHELVVVKSDVAHDAFPAKADTPTQADEDAAGEVIGEIEPDDLPAQASASATFNLSPGKYVLLCNVPGHYQLGMSLAFTVTEASSPAPAEMSPPATGSGGLLDGDSDSAFGWALPALAIGVLVAFGLAGMARFARR